MVTLQRTCKKVQKTNRKSHNNIRFYTETNILCKVEDVFFFFPPKICSSVSFKSPGELQLFSGCSLSMFSVCLCNLSLTDRLKSRQGFWMRHICCRPLVLLVTEDGNSQFDLRLLVLEFLTVSSLTVTSWQEKLHFGLTVKVICSKFYTFLLLLCDGK